MINSNFVILAVFFNLIGSFGYAYDTFRGKTKPNRVSWFLWGLAPLIAFSAMVTGGVGISSLMTFMVGFGPLAVFFVSFVNPNAYWKIGNLDISCGILSLLAIVLWIVTKNGVVAILFSILADGLAAIPTVIKSIKEPESESYNVFFFSALSAVITMLTIKNWDFSTYGFPVYIFLICMLLFILIFRKQGIQLIKK